jgi:hypothetical protein
MLAWYFSVVNFPERSAHSGSATSMQGTTGSGEHPKLLFVGIQNSEFRATRISHLRPA